MQQPHAFTQVTGKFVAHLLSKRPPISVIKQIHAQIITQSLALSRPSLTDSLIHCYLHSNNLNSSRTLFDHHPSPSPPTLIWNLMIRAYSKSQRSSEAIRLFHQMLNTRSKPDKYTFTFVISSSAHQSSILYGQIVHGMLVKNGSLLNLYVANSLISMYAVFLKVEDACKVFEEMTERDVFSWTSLLTAYTKNGNMQKACDVFREMPMRNNVSWAVMISGFVSSEMYNQAIEYFHSMICEVKPNEAVLVCALSACANLGSFEQGKWIHDYINKKCIPETSNITTALIDMYSKCGRIDLAYQVFDNIPQRGVQNFTSMISGLSIHGLGEQAIRVFQQMLAENLKPNEITILGVLNGCSHSGIIQHGTSIFYNMENLWGVVPKIEHYGCYIDLLGRAGFLAKAFGIVKNMPISPDVVIWRALLSACRIHRNDYFGERVMSHLEQLDVHSCAGGDVLLSNLYASLGKWENVSRIRNIMGNKENKQSDIGRSWVEVSCFVHES